MSFACTFASTPFCLDNARADVAEFLAKNLPLGQNDLEQPPSPFPGKNVYGLAVPPWRPLPNIRIGEWYYPTGAVRWSQFTGLASTAQKDAMVEAALPSTGATACTFLMQADAVGPEALSDKTYEIETEMYMLPPRPLAVHGDNPGLWLITLVDERYYWQWRSAGAFTVASTTTWANLITALVAALDIVIAYDAVSATYLAPEPDSQLWTNYESAALLLDAVAWNIGCTVVRNLDGTYNLQSNADAVTQSDTNRGTVIRTAGGDMIDSADAVTLSPGVTVIPSAQAVLPGSVTVTFPKYVTGGVPHMYNPRIGEASRPSCWTEDSYGAVYAKVISLADAGAPYSNYVGYPGTKVFRDTAKALSTSEANAASNTLTNSAALDALALLIAQDYYAQQINSALDEVYPGTLLWTPEAIHDVVWTYKNGMACTRVFRLAWNYNVNEFQHSSGVPSGVGGHAIALTVRDGSTTVNGVNLVTFSGATVASVAATDGLQEVTVTTGGTGPTVQTAAAVSVTVGAVNNNVSLTSGYTFYRLSGSGTGTTVITGFTYGGVEPSDGQMFEIENNTSYPMTFRNAGSGSTYPITTGLSVDSTIGPGEIITFKYNTTSNTFNTFSAPCATPAVPGRSVGGTTSVMDTATTIRIANVTLAVGDILLIPYAFYDAVNTGAVVVSGTWGVNAINTGAALTAIGTISPGASYGTYQCTSAGTHDLTITVDLSVSNGVMAAVVISGKSFIDQSANTTGTTATSVSVTSSSDIVAQPSLVEGMCFTDVAANIAAGTWIGGYIEGGVALIDASGSITLRDGYAIQRSVATFTAGMQDLSACNSVLFATDLYGGTMPDSCCECPTTVDPDSDTILDGGGPDGLQVQPGPKATIIDSMSALYN